MDFKTYQKLAHKTADYPEIIIQNKEKDAATEASYYYALGLLFEEGGELAGKISKATRNRLGEYGEADIKAIEKEIGDILWSVAELCTVFGINMGDCAKGNILKLEDRAKRGVIKSEGDNR